ncbi:MAG: squalene--hopene cyclase [Actinobacteria bacterium]|nr:squalene--hopene cyclase [Actinomycetota bacterium]
MSNVSKSVLNHSGEMTTPTEIRERINNSIKRAQEFFFDVQSEEGYWVGELEADISVTSGFLPLTHFMGIVDPTREKKMINQILSKQRDDGTWPMYHDGPGSLDVTIQSYFALKLAGIPPDDPRMRKAHEFILANGGVARTNTFTKILLALFGQYRWDGLPIVPPEIIFIPNWCFINIYDLASWTRETIMALTIIFTLKPVFKISDSANILELFVDEDQFKNPAWPRARHFFSWGNLILVAMKCFRLWEKLPSGLKFGRKRALRKVEKWIVDHQEPDGSWGGIMLPWVYSLAALKALGYSNGDPVLAKGIAGLEDFIVEDSDNLWVEPATSPVWDTAWTIIALRESGISSDHPALQQTGVWLLNQQIKIRGDWSIKNPRLEPGCWAFEFENDLYPDVDDTSLVSQALNMIILPDENAKSAAIKIGINWVLGMQNKNGSWAAFDRDNHKSILKDIPFADFVAPLDPGSPDITGHVVTALVRLGYGLDFPPIARALNYIKKSQEEDGSWFGRWGVNYIYGTSKVLQALRMVGEDMDEPYIRRAIDWLQRQQNPDGGWGESCMTYEKPQPEFRGRGISTSSQTAWALLGLMSAGGDSSAIARGIEFLISKQQINGSWHEDEFTGTGFPRAFYLRYEHYKNYFPLMALAKYAKSEYEK